MSFVVAKEGCAAVKPVLAARIHAALTTLVCAFQLALAMGAPWGHLAMGGQFPGSFPPALRVAALLQAFILALLSVVVSVRAGRLLPRFHRASRALIWLVVGVGAVSSVANVLTPSAAERLLWAPVALALLFTSLRVARSR